MMKQLGLGDQSGCGGLGKGWGPFTVGPYGSYYRFMDDIGMVCGMEEAKEEEGLMMSLNYFVY